MLNKLSIRSKLLVLLLFAGLLAAAWTAYLSYRTAEQALSSTIYSQLTSIREAKRQQVQRYFADIRKVVNILAGQPSVVTATEKFADGFVQLGKSKIGKLEQTRLTKFYNEKFLKKLAANTDGTPRLPNFIPRSFAGLRAQNDYLSANPFPVGEKQKHLIGPINDYGLVHKDIHPTFVEVIEQFGFYDLFLIEPDNGTIVYSVYKEVDFGTRLLDGPHSRSGLAVLVKNILASPDDGVVQFQDFSNYAPSYNAPASFMGTPLFNDGRLVGILAVQLSITDLNQVMTSDGKWEEVGLGKTGEVYLVGQDRLLRSSSRFELQDRDGYLKALRRVGVSTSIVNRIRRVGTSILNQPVETVAVSRSFLGKSATEIIEDYRGEQVLSSYSPIDLTDTTMAILAEIDVSEAFAPLEGMRHKMLIALCGIAIFLTLLALMAAHSITRPIYALLSGVKKLASGDTTTKVRVTGRDEISQLGTAFNSMVSQLHQHNEEIESKTREYEGLLRRIFPEHIASKVSNGDEIIAETYTDITVVHGMIGNFDHAMRDLSAKNMMQTLNELIGQFDILAERFGVEKIKTIGDSYIAAAGLPNPQHNHAQLAADFALAMVDTVKQFNESHGLQLTFRAGLSTGEVDIGVVGRKRFVYEILGAPVVHARTIASASPDNSVLLHGTTECLITSRNALQKSRTVPDPQGGTLPVREYIIRAEKSGVSAKKVKPKQRSKIASR